MHIRVAAVEEAKWNTAAFNVSLPTQWLTFPVPDVIFIVQTQLAQLSSNYQKKKIQRFHFSLLTIKNVKKMVGKHLQVFFPLVASVVELAATNKSLLCDV